MEFKPSFSLFNSIFPDSTPYYKRIIKLLNEVICFNQGELAQYIFTAGEKHKDMKEALREKNPSSNTVEKLKGELETFLNEEFERIVDRNLKYIKDYFDGRAKREPRVCVKIIKNNSLSGFFREEDLFLLDGAKIEEEKGLSCVNENGQFYICNNIPDEIRGNRYFNSDINDHKALQYKKSTFLNYIHQKLGKEDKKWIECWNQSNINGKLQTPFAKQCYKSTIITPMTLSGNTLSREFKRQFRIRSKPERAIYGFLCIDHHHTDYFAVNTDKPACYIFADLLSLYLIINLIYTEYSNTYKKAIKFITGR